MSKLEKLTPEQEKLMATVRDEWVNRVWVNPKRIDREQATKGVNFIYKLARLEAPHIIFVDSPLGAQYCANIVVGGKLKNSSDSISDSVSDSVVDSIRDSVGASIWSSVSNSVRNSVRNSVWDSVRSSVGNSVGDSVRNSVRNSVRSSVGSSVGDSVRGSVRNSVWDSVRNSELINYSFTQYGSVADFGWTSYYDFFVRIKVLKNENFNNWVSFLHSGIYDCIVFDKVCIVCQMPSKIHGIDIDGRKVLHSDIGPAIEWEDGYKIYRWKGYEVPEKLILTPTEVTHSDLKKWSENTELRRCCIEALGVKNYYQILSNGDGLIEIDTDIDNQGNPMTLYQFEFEGNSIQVLECKDPSTDRVYNLYPPNQQSKNVWEAKGSTFNMGEEIRETLIES